MKIGQVARRTGVSVRMLRYYESESLLSPARTTSGYRVFHEADVETVERIKLLSSAGMTLPAIREFLPCSLGRRGEFESCEELKSMLRDRIDEVDTKIATLSEGRRLLTGILVEMEQSTP